MVVRVVYDGPATSGKTTSLRALADRFGQVPVFTPEEAAGRTLYFDWMEYTGGRFEGRQIRCQVISAPGQAELAARRQLLLSSADAVVFVADTSLSRMPASVAHLEDLMSTLAGLAGLPVGVVLQANKRDLADAQPLAPWRAKHGLAVVESVASVGEGIREAFVFAVRLALDRVREQMRRGELRQVPPEKDPAGELLRRMRALPVRVNGQPLWTPPPVRRAASAGGPPPVPSTTVPSGWIWPPVQGRILLQEACLGALTQARELGPGDWLADSAAGWRFYSSSSCVYPDSESARSALIRWAQLHVACGTWISSHRCIAVCDAGDGSFRLWQIVRNERSLWHGLSEALASRDAALIAEATHRCDWAAQQWAQGPHDLPCTLETVGITQTGTAFVGLMPEPGGARAAEPADRRAKLRHQMETLVKAELGGAQDRS